jgi:hypothetical protein
MYRPGGVTGTDQFGNLLVALAASSVTVQTQPVTSNTVTQNGVTVIGTASSQALASNSNRKRLIIQNVGTTNLYILYGTGTAGPSNFTRILPAGGTPLDGSSVPIIDDMWQGPVQWASSASGGEGTANELT